MPPKKSEITAEAEVMALNMLAFIASDEQRLGAFLNLTGTPPGDLPKLARDRHFLAGVFDFMLSDQSLLLTFAENQEMKPESLSRARRGLPGAADD